MQPVRCARKLPLCRRISKFNCFRSVLSLEKDSIVDFMFRLAFKV